MKFYIIFLASLMSICLNSCYFFQKSHGGGQIDWEPPRKTNTADIALPEGYKIEIVAENLTFPTNITFDDKGRIYVIEAGYSYGEVFTTPRLLRVDGNNNYKTIAEGPNNGPWTSIWFHKGSFYISEGGELEGGRILIIDLDGKMTILLDSLPSMGDHHTNAVIADPDGNIYFGIGTATNSGIVGNDNAHFGWLKRKPEFHDIPCRDITLKGLNFETDNALTGNGDDVETGAFQPYGTKTAKGQVIRGAIPCTGSILKLDGKSSKLELIAWGFRNPFGLAFSSDGILYVTENSYDDRGSRPVWGTGDVLWEIKNGLWYGWPDMAEGRMLQDVEPLLQDRPNDPPRPVAILGVHSSSNGFDFSRSNDFGYTGEAFIAQFGDQAPVVGKTLAPVGFKIVRVNIKNGNINDFAVNKGDANGPASWIGTAGLERPVAARFSPDGKALFIVDFGVMVMSSKGSIPQNNTGVVWKVTKE